MLHVSGGTTIKRGSAIPASGTKMGSHAELARYIKAQVNIPVATVGRITEAWIADEMIANGMTDACMMGRANLCEPEFVNKVYEGREDEIRPCIGCLRCLNGIMFGKREQQAQKALYKKHWLYKHLNKDRQFRLHKLNNK